MTAVPLDRLEALYAHSGDPWEFRTSAYERAKYAATLSAMARAHYREILEIGCGNGEFGRLLASRCHRYVGIDAVPRALEEARTVLPAGTFECAFFPCRLPKGDFDLIMVSEFLYFLDASGIEKLAAQIQERWPAAEIISVNHRGPTGNHLQGDQAADLLVDSLKGAFEVHGRVVTAGYRIDRLACVHGQGNKA